MESSLTKSFEIGKSCSYTKCPFYGVTPGLIVMEIWQNDFIENQRFQRNSENLDFNKRKCLKSKVDKSETF